MNVLHTTKSVKTTQTQETCIIQALTILEKKTILKNTVSAEKGKLSPKVTIYNKKKPINHTPTK